MAITGIWTVETILISMVRVRFSFVLSKPLHLTTLSSPNPLDVLYPEAHIYLSHWVVFNAPWQGYFFDQCVFFNLFITFFPLKNHANFLLPVATLCEPLPGILQPVHKSSAASRRRSGSMIDGSPWKLRGSPSPRFRHHVRPLRVFGTLRCHRPLRRCPRSPHPPVAQQHPISALQVSFRPIRSPTKADPRTRSIKTRMFR